MRGSNINWDQSAGGAALSLNTIDGVQKIGGLIRDNFFHIEGGYILYAKRSIGCGIAIKISASFAINIKSYYSLIISILNLKS